jgi:hypothetical protein
MKNFHNIYASDKTVRRWLWWRCCRLVCVYRKTFFMDRATYIYVYTHVKWWKPVKQANKCMLPSFTHRLHAEFNWTKLSNNTFFWEEFSWVSDLNEEYLLEGPENHVRSLLNHFILVDQRDLTFVLLLSCFIGEFELTVSYLQVCKSLLRPYQSSLIAWRTVWYMGLPRRTLHRLSQEKVGDGSCTHLPSFLLLWAGMGKVAM